MPQDRPSWRKIRDYMEELSKKEIYYLKQGQMPALEYLLQQSLTEGQS